MNRFRHTVSMARHVGITFTLAVFLTACSGHHEISQNSTGNQTADNTIKDSVKAATSPLDDLGLRKQEIPQRLLVIVANPYQRPAPFRCATLTGEIAELDNMLGEDIDAPKTEETNGQHAAEVGADLIHDGIVGLVSSHTSFIPFRGIIRRITGAERHEKEVANAYEAGKLRRAYLKGLAQANFKHCIYAPTAVAKKEDKAPAAVDHNQEAPPIEVASSFPH